MIIYIVAGERNIQTVETLGGLYFNLGQTSRSVEERLKDPDYRRKNAAGKWVVLHKWEVEDSLTDSVFHELLEDNGIDRSGTNNTEEFFAHGDDGTADEVAKIIQDYIDKHSTWKIEYENIRFKAFLAYRDAQLEELSKEFAELNDEYQNYKLTDASKLIDNVQRKEEQLNTLSRKIESDEAYLDDMIVRIEKKERQVDEAKADYEKKLNEVPPAKLKLDDIKDFFSSWTWVWLIVLFFSLVECSDRGKTISRLRGEFHKKPQSNKVVEKKDEPLYDENTMILIKGPMLEAKKRCVLHYKGYAHDTIYTSINNGAYEHSSYDVANNALNTPKGKVFLQKNTIAIRSSMWVVILNQNDFNLFVSSMEAAPSEIAGVDWTGPKPSTKKRTEWVYPCSITRNGEQSYYGKPARFVIDNTLKVDTIKKQTK